MYSTQYTRTVSAILVLKCQIYCLSRLRNGRFRFLIVLIFVACLLTRCVKDGYMYMYTSMSLHILQMYSYNYVRLSCVNKIFEIFKNIKRVSSWKEMLKY